MSESEERVYTINLAKTVLAPRGRRCERAINTIKEFAMKHMKSEEVSIDEEVNNVIWSRGIRKPPRSIRVKMIKEANEVKVQLYTEKEEKKQ